jgi:hypothetical protein
LIIKVSLAAGSTLVTIDSSVRASPDLFSDAIKVYWRRRERRERRREIVELIVI